MVVERVGWEMVSLCLPRSATVEGTWAFLGHLPQPPGCIRTLSRSILQLRRPRASLPWGPEAARSEGKQGKVGCVPTDASVFQASLLIKPLHITFTAASKVFRVESSLR